MTYDFTDEREKTMKLLVLDLEGTIFKNIIRLKGTNIDSTIWQGLAMALGKMAIYDEVKTHENWSKGKYKNYLEWMTDTVEIHKKHDLTKNIFDSVINSADYNNGVIEFFNKLNRNEYIPVIISGGFVELGRRASLDLKIKHCFAACQYYFNDNGKLESYNLLPCDFNGKIDFIRIMLKEYGITDWIFIGDGKNDIEIAKIAPISVGMNPHIELKEHVDYVISDFRELSNIV